MDTIEIKGLRVDCVVGVYPEERDRLQPLEVDLALAVDTRRAARSERLSHTVDYAAVANQLAFLLRSCRFFMLETAARALCRSLLLPPAEDEQRPPIEEVRLRLTKPTALSGHGIPSLEIKRLASEADFSRESNRWGTVDVIDETQHVGIYRLNIAPKSGIPLHVHRQMRESELVLGDGLRCQGEAVTAGTIFDWPHDAPHRYDNPTERWQSILCVDSPPFIPDDEIEVDGDPAVIRPTAPLIPRRVPA